MTAQCSKCGAEPRLPGQSWGRACFARYRRQERAGKQKPKGEHGAPQNRAPESPQGAKAGQVDGGPLLPSLTVKVHPYGIVLRFPGGRLHPEDGAVLAKFERGVFHSAHVWLEPLRRTR